MKITFVAGWASDPAQYPELAKSARFLIPFSGFRPEELPSMLESGGDVLMGWSTGAHILLKECPHLFDRFKKVILVAPFLAFTHSFPERLVRGMISSLDEDPAKMIASFHSNCGETLELPYDPSGADHLRAGLEYLISSSIDGEGPIEIENLTIIYGSRDKIVRRKAINRVMEFVRPAEVIDLDCGHKVPENELLGLLK